jgi:hypothetical protein
MPLHTLIVSNHEGTKVTKSVRHALAHPLRYSLRLSYVSIL